jgi:hypothetical protein
MSPEVSDDPSDNYRFGRKALFDVTKPNPVDG